jgi:hypothetical protein
MFVRLQYDYIKVKFKPELERTNALHAAPRIPVALDRSRTVELFCCA